MRLGALLVLLSAPAWAQSLRFDDLRTSYPAHFTQGPFRVQRLLANGDDDTGPALTVQIQGSTTDVALQTDDTASFDTWLQSLDLDIAAGSTYSTPFYLRAKQQGSFSLTVQATTGAARKETKNLSIDPPSFADDFETGTLRQTLPKPGHWSYVGTAQGPVDVIPAAAHRGRLGMRCTDPAGPNASKFPASVAANFDPRAGDFYLRGWTRVVTSGGTGEVRILKVDIVGLNSGIFELVHTPDDTLYVTAWDDTTFHFGDVRDGGVLPVGEWHLVDVLQRGVNGPDASTEAYVDGTLISQVAGLNLNNRRDVAINVGAFFENDPNSNLTIDWDDVRATTQPQGTFLFTRLASSATQGCVGVIVELRDVFGLRAPIPYPLDLTPGPGTTGPFSDATCLVPTTISTARQSNLVYVNTVGGGDPTRLTHPDFLSGRTDFSLDAGPDDAGVTEVDGGVPDGGAGTPASSALKLGCGCSASSDGLLALLSLAVLKRRRR